MALNGTRVSRPSSGSHDRKLRYRALLENLSTLEDEDENNVTRMDKTANAVKEAQALLAEGDVEDKSRHPGEGYLDSRVLHATSDLSVRCAEAVSGNVNSYDRHQLAQHIKDNPDFWFFMVSKEVPSMLSLFGTFTPTPPEQRPRVARRVVERQKPNTLTAPEAVNQMDKVEEGSELVTRVNRLICKYYRNNGNTPLSYFHFVLDPDSFSRTVENIYHVSFLVRDGMVAIELDEDNGLPYITPVPATQQDQRDLGDENQFVVSLDMPQWKKLIEAFQIVKPMMVLKRS